MAILTQEQWNEFREWADDPSHEKDMLDTLDSLQAQLAEAQADQREYKELACQYVEAINSVKSLLAINPACGHRNADRIVIDVADRLNGQEEPVYGCRICAEREQAVREALEQAVAKVRKVASGYLAGGHSHRAQMLEALAREIEHGASPKSVKQEPAQAEAPQVAEGQAASLPETDRPATVDIAAQPRGK